LRGPSPGTAGLKCEGVVPGSVPADEQADEQADPRLVGAGVGLAVLAVSTAAVLIRLSSAPSMAIATHRLLFATLLLGPVALLHPERRRDLSSLGARDLAGLAAVGVVLAVHFAAWIDSLAWTTVAASVVLVTLHPVFVGVASDLLYDEGLGTLGWAGVAVAFAGGVVVVAGDVRLPVAHPRGAVLALVGAAAAGAYFLAGRAYRRRLPLLAYVVPVYAACAVALAAAGVAAGVPLTGYAWREWAIFLALALVPMVVGHTLLNWALRHVTAPVVATAVLGEPVGSTLLAVLVLGEVPPGITLLGGLVTLAGIGLVVYEDNQPGEPEDA